LDLTGSNRTLEKLHNELHDLYFSSETITMVTSWRIVGVGYVACMGVNRNAYRTLVAQLDGMTLLGRTRYEYAWEDNIKMDHTKLGGVGMN
jgi:hypothetical protein